jgi:NDP-sugar pyrophosphorylase family protein
MTAAMILCAGYGKRLGDLSRDLPKPMIPVKGRPILEYSIRHLAKLGINNIIINLHYLPDIIKNYFREGTAWNVHIDYSYEEEPLGTAGAVKKAEAYLRKYHQFLVLYGDIVCNQDYRDLLKFHQLNSDAIGTIVLHERNKSNSIVEMDGNNKITRFIERPQSEVSDKKQNWVNSGLYCFSNSILDRIPAGKYCDFPQHVFNDLIHNGHLYGFPLNGYRCAIDSPERYKIMIEDFNNGRVFQDVL